MREEGDPAAVTAADETAYIFTPDKLPSQRQLFYQLCDLKDDSLQAIVHSNDGRETTCTVRRRLALLHWLCYMVAVCSSWIASRKEASRSFMLI